MHDTAADDQTYGNVQLVFKEFHVRNSRRLNEKRQKRKDMIIERNKITKVTLCGHKSNRFAVFNSDFGLNIEQKPFETFFISLHRMFLAALFRLYLKAKKQNMLKPEYRCSCVHVNDYIYGFGNGNVKLCSINNTYTNKIWNNKKAHACIQKI